MEGVKPMRDTTFLIALSLALMWKVYCKEINDGRDQLGGKSLLSVP